MDEIILRVARALASRPRLRILTFLARQGETTPTTLADELGMPLNTVSRHLRALTTAGLITGRKSGPRCHYAATSPYGPKTLSGAITRWLHRLLATDAAEDNRGLPEVRDYPVSGSDPDSQLHAAVFEAATAFTDLRRIQILRLLTTRGEATVSDLVTELSMSEDAVSRHTTKLRRRGYLEARRAGGRTLAFRLAWEAKSPIHQRLFEIVRDTWEER